MVVEMILPRQDAVDDLFPGVGEYGPSYDTVLNIAEGFNKFNKKEWKAFFRDCNRGSIRRRRILGCNDFGKMVKGAGIPYNKSITGHERCCRKACSQRCKKWPPE